MEEIKVCEYGCGQEAKFILKNGKHCCSKTSNQCESIRKKNSLKTEQRHKEGKAYEFSKEDRSESRISYDKKYNDLTFEKKHLARKKREILEEQGGKCLICGLSKWMGKEISLELDHIDGDHDNNKRENFRVLCPNCHSQTSTFKGRGKKNGPSHSEQEIIETIKRSENIRQVLLKLKMDPKGANYNKIRRIIFENKLNIGDV
jgi:5-methylcytosine-specific restriction endonuclease McrA